MVSKHHPPDTVPVQNETLEMQVHDGAVRRPLRYEAHRIFFFLDEVDESQSDPDPLKHVCHLAARIILISV